jgi:hypothetical protein
MPKAARIFFMGVSISELRRPVATTPCSGNRRVIDRKRDLLKSQRKKGFANLPPTLRVYTKEIERLVLWMVVVRGVALSSMTVEDCEAYKDFLKGPVASFVGPKRPCSSGRWRPFTPEGLSADSCQTTQSCPGN